MYTSLTTIFLIGEVSAIRIAVAMPLVHDAGAVSAGGFPAVAHLVFGCVGGGGRELAGSGNSVRALEGYRRS